MPSTEHLDQNAPSAYLDRARITVLDLAPLFEEDITARDELEQQIRDACYETGFLCVHNSGVDDTVIRDVLTVSEAFFHLSDQDPVKQAVHNRFGGDMKGWGPMFGEPAYQPGTLAHVESFDIGQQLEPGRYRELGIEPNIWPDIPGFRDAVLTYYATVTAMGRALSEVFSGLLGEERDFLNHNSTETAPRTMRLLNYPANEAPDDGRHVGISAHTDFECFTIIHQTAPGLELTDTNGDWYKAPSDAGTFTIILGDMLERFSNGHLKATGHRVVNTPWQRFSMAFFFAVNGEFKVAPLAKFTGADNPSRYAAVTQDEHIRIELERASANKQPVSGGQEKPL
jgi:isopenicillin N synthase-like dioxygenase